MELVFATYLAPSIRPVYELVADRVAAALGVSTRLISGADANELAAGGIDFAFVCGLPYVRLRRLDPPPVVALAAPVVAGERYQDRPIYFSDVVVPAASTARTLADLRGCSWAYNEPASHSGYLATLHRLLQEGGTGAFFGRTMMTGFHQESIRGVAEGEVDASAIDSQVLDVAFDREPGLRDRLRVIDTFGPSTIQPFVAATTVDPGLRTAVREVVQGLGGSPEERAALDRGLVRRFVAVEDADYDDIRVMLADVEAAGLSFGEPT